MKHNLKKTMHILAPCRDGFCDVIISLIWSFHITMFLMAGSTGREGGRAVRMPSFEACLPHWFTPWSWMSPWAVPVASDILHSQSMNHSWWFLLGHQFPLGKQRCSLPHCVFLPILSFTICSPIVHLSPVSKDYLIWGQFVNTYQNRYAEK